MVDLAGGLHALPPLTNSKNMPTGAVYGVANILRKLMAEYPEADVVVVFDAPGKTFRDDWYPEYKAQRAPMPPELRAQIEPIHEVVKLLGWPVLMVPGVEADDVIGTLCCVGANAGHKVIVSTGDKDLSQLVNPDVELINTMSNERLDEAGVLAKFGVPPDRIIDYLTLMGDTVDNVPGVVGVGPKTAAKWIAEYGSLDGVIAAAPGVKGKAGENLRAHRLGINGVPCFIVNRKYAVSGAQPPSAFVEVFNLAERDAATSAAQSTA